MGFLCLIYGLCLEAGVRCYINPVDRVVAQVVLRRAAFEIVKKRKKKGKKTTLHTNNYSNEDEASISAQVTA